MAVNTRQNCRSLGIRNAQKKRSTSVPYACFWNSLQFFPRLICRYVAEWKLIYHWTHPEGKVVTEKKFSGDLNKSAIMKHQLFPLNLGFFSPLFRNQGNFQLDQGWQLKKIHLKYKKVEVTVSKENKAKAESKSQKQSSKYNLPEKLLPRHETK